MSHAEVCAHLGLHPYTPLTAGTFLRLDWSRFQRLAAMTNPCERG